MKNNGPELKHGGDLSAAEMYSFLFVIFRWLPNAYIEKLMADALYPVIVELGLLGLATDHASDAFSSLSKTLQEFRQAEEDAFRQITAEEVTEIPSADNGDVESSE